MTTTGSTTAKRGRGRPRKENPREAQLLAEIAELKSKLEEKTYEEPYALPISDGKIQQDDYISVMSLIPFNLNLATRPGGQGSVKRFNGFGQVKKVLYRDLVEIIETHHNFLEAGYFYILNPAVIREHGLDEMYSKILTKEKIDEILSAQSDACVEIYKTANEKQQEMIVELIIERLIEDSQGVNLNVVDRISRVSNVDISKVAEDRKRGQQILEQEQS